VIELTWQQVVTGKDVSYNIYRSEDGLIFNIEESTSSSSVIDTTVFLGGHYYYYVTTVLSQWESNPSDTVDALVEAITWLTEEDRIPATYNLRQNFPNPFNPSTLISYQLAEFSKVELSIYNVLGEKVATLVFGNQPAGHYQIEWDATRFSSGVYFYHLKANNFSQVLKMILVR
jgi:hypothetical protein